MAKKETFEEKIEKIKEYLSLLENDETKLDESIKIYEKCQKLIKEAEDTLEEASGKVKKIIEKIDGIEISDLDEND